MGKFREGIADATRLAVFDDTIRANVRATGEIFWVVEDSDTDFNLLTERYGNKNVFTTLSDAYAAAVTNRNDVIFLTGNSTHSISAGIAWTKNRIHVVGLDGGDRLVQQGAKIQLGGAITTAYVIKNTGVRNSFHNIKFIQASTAATALTAFQDGGEGTLFRNCSFVFGVVNNLGGTTAHEF